MLTINARRLALLLGILLLVIGVTVIATLRLSNDDGAKEWLSNLLSSKPPETKLSDKPLFKNLERFVISLEGQSARHYLVLEMSLVTHDPDQLQTFEEVNPLLRNAAVELFGKRSYEDTVVALQQVEQLQQQVLDKFRKTLEAYGYKQALDKVLFTKVVLQ